MLKPPRPCGTPRFIMSNFDVYHNAPALKLDLNTSVAWWYITKNVRSGMARGGGRSSGPYRK
jgi:hypothetical protein